MSQFNIQHLCAMCNTGILPP